MGLEKVKQEILDNARKEASAMIEAAQAEGRSIANAAEKQAGENDLAAEEKLQRDFDFMKRREVASAELELRKQVLATKSAIVEKVFGEAANKLKSLAEKKREAHIKALLYAARNELSVAVVRCNSMDVNIVEAFGEGRLKIIPGSNLLGGIIAESSDGRLRVDYSYEAVLEQVRSRVLGDVARALFRK